MRKLTALSVALSLSAAGQAFAGEPHAPAAHSRGEVIGKVEMTQKAMEVQNKVGLAKMTVKQAGEEIVDLANDTRDVLTESNQTNLSK
jgi:hypothetical protein